MSQCQWIMESSIGPLYLVANDHGLEGIFWKKRPVKVVDSLKGKDKAHLILRQAISEIEEYLEGRREVFDVPLDPQGTEFQKRVWKELSKIPYGKTYSYKDIAKKLNQENASRAVGTANGKNPLSLIVPCHRVINANGKLGGYAGGLSIKQKLLALESRIKS